MKQKVLTAEQIKVIDDNIKKDSEKAKLLGYLKRHEIVGKEIFPYLRESKPDIEYDFMYNPVRHDVFIKRLPIYFYQ